MKLSELLWGMGKELERRPIDLVAVEAWLTSILDCLIKLSTLSNSTVGKK